MIAVAARSSPLSQAQISEVLKLLPSWISFEPHFVQSTGDLDLKTSLRTLDKTDFFTKEVDQLVLNSSCRISIHSAKDLPENIPQGLKVIAITRGIDPSDSLVMREYDTFENLKAGSVIATSSNRREEAVKRLRSDLTFRDLRGTIQARLALLEKGEADGVVVAEAALIRLKLTHLNRIHLPGSTTPMQGQLAICAREEDEEMEILFAPLDFRNKPLSLYLGPEYPSKAFPDKRIVHCPLIETKSRPCSLQDWPQYTHLIFTSKTAVRHLVDSLRKARISPVTLASKTILAVGQATGDLVRAFGAIPLIAKEECAEGIVSILNAIDWHGTHFFWPHSSLSRPLIENTLTKITSCILYDTFPVKNPSIPSLNDFQEVLFSSPSTVSAFFSQVPTPPPHLKFTPIGKITQEALDKYIFS